MAGAPLGLAQSDVSARDLIFRALDQGRTIPLTGVVLYRRNPRSNDFKTVKVEQSSGRMKMTVLSPLSEQGVTMLDDGKTWTTYLPDSNWLMVQPSPRLFPVDNAQRKSLADRNYRFTTERSVVIAGRETVAIVASPKLSEMPERRYYFDEANSVMLRLEVGDGANRRLLYDTAEISFPNAVRDEVFQLRTVKRARKMEIEPPMTLERPRTVAREVGFVPVVPDRLPLGFVIQARQVVGPRDSRYVAIRLTDGLVTATVYQWSTGTGRKLPFEAWASDLLLDEVAFRADGELPQPLLDVLAEAFVSTARKGRMARAEPSLASDLLDMSMGLWVEASADPRR